MYDSSGFANLVNTVQQYITLRTLANYTSSPGRDDLVIKSTKLLGFLCNYFLIQDDVNQLGNFISYKEFYNETINEQLDIKEDFPKWKGKDG